MTEVQSEIIDYSVVEESAKEAFEETAHEGTTSERELKHFGRSFRDLNVKTPIESRENSSSLQSEFGRVFSDAPLHAACDDADPAIVIKVFRAFGTVSGITLEGLLKGVCSLKNDDTKKKANSLLPDLFKWYDSNSDEFLDINEFEKMVNTSLWLKLVVYELACIADDHEHIAALQDTDQLNEDLSAAFPILLVTLNALVFAFQVDHDPSWTGWDYVDLAFACAFTIDLVVRCMLTSNRNSQIDIPISGRGCKYCKYFRCYGISKRIRIFLALGFNTVDVFSTIVAWLGVLLSFTTKDKTIFLDWIRWLRWVRLLRLVRLIVRLWKLALYFNDLALLLHGLVRGLWLALWAFALISLVILMWAISVRGVVEDKRESEDYALLKEAFPNLGRAANLLFRCMVVRTDGSCSVGSNGSLIRMLSHGLSQGFLFEIAWSLTDFFVLIILLIVAAIYITQAADNAKWLRDSVQQHHWKADSDKLEVLDKLIRTLIYPNRGKDRHPKERYAHQEAVKLKMEYPEVAEKFPNLEQELLALATDVQASREQLQTMVYKYQSQELVHFQKLEATPAAKMYFFENEERLYVDLFDAHTLNHLGIQSAPVNAIEVPLLQEESDLEKLLSEAAEAQNYVKSVLLPHSDWALKDSAGPSGPKQWKNSRFLCDEAIDPGPKQPERIKKKVERYKEGFRRNRDYARLGLIYETVAHLIQALHKFVAGIGEGIKLATIENRFRQPHPLGWRDISLLLKVYLPSSGKSHIMEVQMMLRELKELRPMNHLVYENVRHIPDDVLSRLMDRLVTDTTLDLNISKNEWKQCLGNPGVTTLLDHFGIPANSRERLFELIDIDNSGTVSSSEFQEFLRLFRSPAPNLELLACHLRVRDLQQYNRLKLKDDIAKPILKQVKHLLRHEPESELTLVGI